MSERPVKVEKTDARQGKTGVGVRYVLGFGLVLVIAIFVIVYIVMK